MASRKEEKEQRRLERVENERQAAKSKRSRTIVLSIVAALAVAAIAVGAVLLATSGKSSKSEPAADEHAKHDATEPPTPVEGLPSTSPPTLDLTDFKIAVKKAGCKLTKPPAEGREHLKPGAKLPKYKTNPPTSGNHYPQPAHDGTYTTSPSQGFLLHSLEHGRVLLLYNASKTSEEQRKMLKGVYDADPDRVIYAPSSTNMPYAVAAVAWERILGCNTPDPATFDALKLAVQEYRDQGPELILQKE